MTDQLKAEDPKATLSFHEPDTIDEAVELRTRFGPDAMFVAGGSDIGVSVRRHLVRPHHLISLSRIASLQRLEANEGVVHIGAGVTHRRVEKSPIFSSSCVALQEACRTVGSIQTRNVGTIGGNLVNASPAADTPPVLLAFDAVVELAGLTGSRSVRLIDFFEGYRATALRPDELLTCVRHRVDVPRSGSAFTKLGRRRAMEISLGCVGARIVVDEAGRCSEVGIGIGSMAPTSLRATQAEAALLGEQPTRDRLIAAANAAAATCQPISDARATASYRQAVIGSLVLRTLERALTRATNEGGSDD